MRINKAAADKGIGGLAPFFGFSMASASYPERQCKICGRKFWPDGPSAKVCSEDCRLEKKRRESRAAYARQKQEQSVQQVAV